MTEKKTGTYRGAHEPRTLAAILVAALFLVLFACSGVNASTTLKDTMVSASMPLPKLFFSLSSASILLIPLSLVCMICALVALLSRQRNVAMMFSAVSFAAFGLFLFFFSREKMNSALYSPLSDALKEAGVSFKKRDVKGIDVAFQPLAFAALAAAGGTVVLCLP